MSASRLPRPSTRRPPASPPKATTTTARKPTESPGPADAFQPLATTPSRGSQRSLRSNHSHRSVGSAHTPLDSSSASGASSRHISRLPSRATLNEGQTAVQKLRRPSSYTTDAGPREKSWSSRTADSTPQAASALGDVGPERSHRVGASLDYQSGIPSARTSTLRPKLAQDGAANGESCGAGPSEPVTASRPSSFASSSALFSTLGDQQPHPLSSSSTDIDGRSSSPDEASNPASAADVSRPGSPSTEVALGAALSSTLLALEAANSLLLSTMSSRAHLATLRATEHALDRAMEQRETELVRQIEHNRQMADHMARVSAELEGMLAASTFLGKSQYRSRGIGWNPHSATPMVATTAGGNAHAEAKVINSEVQAQAAAEAPQEASTPSGNSAVSRLEKMLRSTSNPPPTQGLGPTRISSGSPLSPRQEEEPDWRKRTDARSMLSALAAVGGGSGSRISSSATVVPSSPSSPKGKETLFEKSDVTSSRRTSLSQSSLRSSIKAVRPSMPTEQSSEEALTEGDDTSGIVINAASVPLPPSPQPGSTPSSLKDKAETPSTPWYASIFPLSYNRAPAPPPTTLPVAVSSSSQHPTPHLSAALPSKRRPSPAGRARSTQHLRSISVALPSTVAATAATTTRITTMPFSAMTTSAAAPSTTMASTLSEGVDTVAGAPTSPSLSATSDAPSSTPQKSQRPPAALRHRSVPSAPSLLLSAVSPPATATASSSPGITDATDAEETPSNAGENHAITDGTESADSKDPQACVQTTAEAQIVASDHDVGAGPASRPSLSYKRSSPAILLTPPNRSSELPSLDTIEDADTPSRSYPRKRSHLDLRSDMSPPPSNVFGLSSSSATSRRGFLTQSARLPSRPLPPRVLAHGRSPSVIRSPKAPVAVSVAMLTTPAITTSSEVRAFQEESAGVRSAASPAGLGLETNTEAKVEVEQCIEDEKGRGSETP